MEGQHTSYLGSLYFCIFSSVLHQIARNAASEITSTTDYLAAMGFPALLYTLSVGSTAGALAWNYQILQKFRKPEPTLLNPGGAINKTELSTDVTVDTLLGTPEFCPGHPQDTFRNTPNIDAVS